MRFTLRRSLALLPAVTMAGCGGYNSMFPKREDIFKPIPVNIGDVSVQGSDTSYVLGGRGYKLVVKDRELLPDAKTTLDRMGASWRQYFAADPTVLTVVLVTPPAKGAKKPAEGARPSPAAGTLVLQTGRLFPEDDPREAMNARMLEGRIGMPIARAWLASFANGGTPPAPDTGVAARRVHWAPSDPRIPDWIESAVPQLVAGASDADFVAAEVARQRDKILPIRSLLTATRPAVPLDTVRRAEEAAMDQRGRGRPGGGGGRGVPALEGVRLFDAQAVTFAEFLAAREGRSFLGRVVAATMGAGSIETVLRDATTLPHDVESLDRAWRGWLEDRAASAGERMGR